LFSYGKIELKIPVFFGWLGSLIISGLLLFPSLDAIKAIIGSKNVNASIAEEQLTVTEEVAREEVMPGYVQSINPEINQPGIFSEIDPENYESILSLFKNPESRERVVQFFANICSSWEIAEVILINAADFDIPPALAFALGWEESRFNPKAVNSKNQNKSVDRGLFQLNSRSFPRLDLQAFFNPSVNSWHGMSHLRYCLDTGGSEIVALAMYNAGTGRVQNNGTPKATLDYIGRILENRQKYEKQFMEQEILFRIQPEKPEEFPEIAEAPPIINRPFLLKPLAGSRQ